jgi:hypothetical protein
MTSCMTPKLKGMAMTKGGKEPRTLYRCAEVRQDEPTAANPIGAHKQMAGHLHPGSSTPGMKRIKGAD